jgi:hypothetical protein
MRTNARSSTGIMLRPTLTALLVTGLITSLLGGCATTRTETKKDLSVFMPGVAREVVIDELGTPVSTTKSRAGTTVDIFTFVQGTAPSKKAPRPVEPEQADATEMMVILDQFGQSPTKLLTGKKMTVQVNYDADERVRDTVLLRME